MTVTGDLPWDYAGMVRERLPGTASLLDLGTGGGELLASLAPLPPRTVATEGHPPNVPVARRRLEPLGVEVVAAGGEGTLPLPTGAFELIVDRHEAYDPHEVRRLLAPGGHVRHPAGDRPPFRPGRPPSGLTAPASRRREDGGQ
ncbi:class I SAM-dependent methyltransferase [Nonomuraea sp. KC401]|nr:methyltransferase domain-containing protein [Nonomuraea sp. K271]TLF70848.1 class I SAM-dependent methyltransferase [Nonomuraea sp. KC401]